MNQCRKCGAAYEESSEHECVNFTPTAADFMVIEPGGQLSSRDKIWKRLTDQENLDFAAELAVDMECGTYIPEDSREAWPPKAYKLSEVMRRMGYSETTVKRSQRPRWYPGNTKFRGYVEWRKRERQMLGKLQWERVAPYMEAMTFMGVSEIARRLQLEPEKVPFRDLAQFTQRGLDVIKGSGGNANEMTGDGADAFVSLRLAVKGIGDSTAANRVLELINAAMSKQQEKVVALQSEVKRG